MAVQQSLTVILWQTAQHSKADNIVDRTADFLFAVLEGLGQRHYDVIGIFSWSDGVVQYVVVRTPALLRWNSFWMSAASLGTIGAGFVNWKLTYLKKTTTRYTDITFTYYIRGKLGKGWRNLRIWYPYQTGLPLKAQ